MYTVFKFWRKRPFLWALIAWVKIVRNIERHGFGYASPKILRRYFPEGRDGRWFCGHFFEHCRVQYSADKDDNPSHDCVIKWKHFPRNWPFVRGIHRSPVNSAYKWSVTWSYGVFFDLHLNKWLSRHRRRRWFETPSRSLWHQNLTNQIMIIKHQNPRLVKNHSTKYLSGTTIT